MREMDNIRQIADLQPDMMGFIFYPKSKRFVSGIGPDIPLDIIKVGVFVDPSFEEVKERTEQFSLNYIQLHGKESAEFCSHINNELEVKVIKVFSISTKINLEEMIPYEGQVDYFLFDTATRDHGGSGKHFNWELLNDYSLQTPFFLSGGIDLQDAEEIKKLKHRKLVGVDINSCFEIKPALKDVKKVEEFLSEMK